MKHKPISFEYVLKMLLLVLTIVSFIGALYFSIENITRPKIINIILAVPFVLFLTPYLVLSLYQIKRVESKMAIVPRFLRDVVDNVESGMDIISSIHETESNEYGVLNEDIKKLSNQLLWGISFEQSIKEFSKNIGSASLERDLRLVIEARNIGGHAEQILRELSEKINTENLRNKERKSNLASNTFTGYVSFVIFIFIIILVFNNLFLGLGQSLGQEGGDAGSDLAEQSNSKMAIFLTLLILLSYELAILSGFLFGLMQENNIIAGAPHVVILSVLVFIGFFFFINF